MFNFLRRVGRSLVNGARCIGRYFEQFVDYTGRIVEKVKKISYDVLEITKNVFGVVGYGKMICGKNIYGNA